MAAKPRVHEVAREMGVDSKVALGVLRAHGEFVKGPSSSIQPPVARKLRAWLADGELGAGAATATDIAAEAQVNADVVLRQLEASGIFISGPRAPIPPPFDERVRAKLGLPRHRGHIQLLGVREYGAVLTRRLPRDLPELAALIRRHVDGESQGFAIMRDAIDAGAMFYAPSSAGRLIAHEGAATILLPHNELLAPAGIAVQAHPEPKKDAAKWLLGWRIYDDRLEIAQTRFRIYSTANKNQTPLLGFEPTVVVRCEPSELGYIIRGQEPAQRLAGLAAAIPEAVEHAPGQEPGRGQQEPSNYPKRSDGDETVLVYLRRAEAGTHDDGGAAGSGIAGQAERRSGQWSVRGFWRNQWYPSEKDHRRIWIDEHLAGNRDVPIVPRRHVYVIRPNP
jgi:hypothetical protein